MKSVKIIINLTTTILVLISMVGIGIIESSNNNVYASETVTEDNLIDEEGKAVVEYSVSVGNNVSSPSTTQPIYIDGTIYVVGKGKLQAIDPTKGTVLKSSKESIANEYTYFLESGLNPETNENMIFIQCGSMVKAFDTNLESKWTVYGLKGTKGYSRIKYSDGYLYGATASNVTNNESATAEMFCINANNGQVEWEYQFERSGIEGEYGTWIGSYWGGITVVEDYVIFAGEGGILYVFKQGAIENANFEVQQEQDSVENTDSEVQQEQEQDTTENTNSVEPDALEPVDKLDLGEEYSCRGGLEYNDGKLYFTANNFSKTGRPATLYEVEFDTKTGKFSSLEDARIYELGGYSVATPTVNNNRLYISAGGGIKVLKINPEQASISLAYTIAGGKGKTYDISIIEKDGITYGYTTYYNKPGGVLVFRDTDNQTKADYFDLASVIPTSSSEYGAAQVLIDPYNSIYFTNDKGKLIKLSGHDLKHIKVSAGYLKHGYEYDECTICQEQFNYKKLEGYGSPGVKSFKVTRGTKSFTAKWTKQSTANLKKMSGYQIRYSTKSSMAGAKYVTASKTAKSKTVKKLSKKKYYYVQARTYVNYKGEKFYSKWSSKKKIKTK